MGKNLTGIHEDTGLIPGLTHVLRIGIAVAVAATVAIRPLAWEPPYTIDAAPKRQKKKKKNYKK